MKCFDFEQSGVLLKYFYNEKKKKRSMMSYSELYTAIRPFLLKCIGLKESNVDCEQSAQSDHPKH